MSASLAQRIAVRQLPPHLKSVLLVLANYARADGSACRPAFATIAAWTGRTVVRTKVAMRELRRRGLIVVTTPHTPRRPAEYALALDRIEDLPSGRRDPQQLDLFAGENAAELSYAQRYPAIGAEIREFSTVSTGLEGSPATPQRGRQRPPIRVQDPCTEIPVQRAREKISCHLPKVGSR